MTRTESIALLQELKRKEEEEEEKEKIRESNKKLVKEEEREQKIREKEAKNQARRMNRSKGKWGTKEKRANQARKTGTENGCGFNRHFFGGG